MNKASLYPSSGPAVMEVSNKVLFVLYGVGVDGVIRESSRRRGYLSGVLKGVQEFRVGSGSRQTTSEGSTRRLPGPEQLLHKCWLCPGRELNGEPGRAFTAKLRGLGFMLREVGGRWKVSGRGMTCSNKDHRRTDWRSVGAPVWAWSHQGESREGYREEGSLGEGIQ